MAFTFGQNWLGFSKILDEGRIGAAVASLGRLLGDDKVAGRSFLDIGAGSGLFSIAAVRLGAVYRIGTDVSAGAFQQVNVFGHGQGFDFNI